MKLQYIVLTLLMPTIYCFGTLVVNSGYGWRAMFGLSLWINLAWCAWRIGKLQGMSFQSWIDRTIGTGLREMGRSKWIARDQGLNKVGSLWCPPLAGESNSDHKQRVVIGRIQVSSSPVRLSQSFGGHTRRSIGNGWVPSFLNGVFRAIGEWMYLTRY